jgi:hypothetical protein
LSGYAALGANGFMHFALSARFATVTTASSGIAAITASRRLVFKAFLSVKLLLSRRKNEVRRAVFAL